MTDPDAGARQRLVAQINEWQRVFVSREQVSEATSMEIQADEMFFDVLAALSGGEASPSSRRAMLEHLASDTCRGNRHEVFLENCPVCVSRLQRLEGALAEGETSGALEIEAGVFRATTSASIFTEGRAAPPLHIGGDVLQIVTDGPSLTVIDGARQLPLAAPEPETGWQPIRALREKWRAREQALCRKADAQPSTQYAQRLAAEAEGIARCADELYAALPPPPAPEREP